jgi:hypothetical protein
MGGAVGVAEVRGACIGVLRDFGGVGLGLAKVSGVSPNHEYLDIYRVKLILPAKLFQGPSK